MANELTKTTESALVPEVWGPRFIESLYDPASVAPRVLNITGDYKGVGDIAHIAVESTAWTVNDLGADGSLTVQSNTMTDVSLTINKEKEITVEVIKTLRRPGYSFEDRLRKFPTTAGNAVREQMENDILALYSGISQTSGDGSGDIGEDNLLDGIRQLGAVKLPILRNPGEFSIVCSFAQHSALKKSGLLDYRRTGEAGGGAANIAFPAAYGIPVIFTNQVSSASSIDQNLMFHRSAFAWAAHRMPYFESQSGVGSGNLTDVLVVWALYGVKTVVANRAVILKSKTVS